MGVGAGNERVVADDGPCLEHVQRLALRQALDDVDQHDIGVVALRKPLRQRGAYVASADDGDLGTHGGDSTQRSMASRVLPPRGPLPPGCSDSFPQIPRKSQYLLSVGPGIRFRPGGCPPRRHPRRHGRLRSIPPVMQIRRRPLNRWERALAYGLLGWVAEVAFTGVRDGVEPGRRSWRPGGASYLWMLPAYR